MSLPSFVVGRSWSGCTREQVKDIFNSRLGDDIVAKVYMYEMEDDKTGIIYGTFWITLKKSTAVVEQMVKQLKTENYIDIIYHDVGYFWRVTLYNHNRLLHEC